MAGQSFHNGQTLGWFFEPLYITTLVPKLPWHSTKSFMPLSSIGTMTSSSHTVHRHNVGCSNTLACLTMTDRYYMATIALHSTLQCVTHFSLLSFIISFTFLFSSFTMPSESWDDDLCFSVGEGSHQCSNS